MSFNTANLAAFLAAKGDILASVDEYLAGGLGLDEAKVILVGVLQAQGGAFLIPLVLLWIDKHEAEKKVDSAQARRV